MEDDAKTDKISELLEGFYPETPTPLEHKDAYTLLVAVLLSAQCTDERVNKVTPGLFELADTPEAMVELDVDVITDAIRSCGLAPTKAKNIKALSEMLIEEHGGEVPGNLPQMEKLPGVGHKTASVVLTQWFGEPAFPVDTHIHRLAARWGLSKANNVAQTERDLKKLFPRETWGKRHLQFIFFGREYCPARGHDLRECPICGWAATKKRIRQEMGKDAV